MQLPLQIEQLCELIIVGTQTTKYLCDQFHAYHDGQVWACVLTTPALAANPLPVTTILNYDDILSVIYTHIGIDLNDVAVHNNTLCTGRKYGELSLAHVLMAYNDHPAAHGLPADDPRKSIAARIRTFTIHESDPAD